MIRGPSGAGKSTLALCLIHKGWRLVADDRVLIWRSGDRAWGREDAQIAHVIDGRHTGDEIDRIPDRNAAVLCGVSLPACRLDLASPAAADKVAAFCGALRV